jgi:hypothetical protein
MSNKYVKKSLTSLALKEIQIKTTLKFVTYSSQNGYHQVTKQQKCWKWRCNGAANMQISMEVHQKITIDLPYEPAIQILGLYLKELKSADNTDTYTPMFM